MKFTLNWLKRHLDTDASLEEICDRLTAIGLEVEEFFDPAATYAPFSVAYVESAEQHPDADKLKLCTVKSKDGTFQVVCGAPNARTGMKGIFAPEGSYIPGLDVTLKKAKIRGVESCGMLVSEKEMMLSEEHDGIIEVDDSHEIGTPMADIFGLNDPIIEINLTPNRADCTGVRGIARDLAAAGLGSLKPLEMPAIKSSGASSTKVSIEDAEGCPHFMGRMITGVKNGPSPKWMHNLLKAVGLRPISALVDITNFMNIDHGRPLHVYDADKLSGDIVVRTTKDGESLQALNDKTYENVGNAAIGITDDSGLIGLGGIVGGVSTGSESDTVNVFLESAYFDPQRIARTGRDLGVISDARYRFERGVDPAFTAGGLDIAAALIAEICGGEISDIVEAGNAPDHSRSIEYNAAYCEQLIGLPIDEKVQHQILGDLGFEVKDKAVSIPSWRGDIQGKADLVEEVIRIYGFDKIPEVSVRSKGTVPASAETTTLSRIRSSRTALAARGMMECVTWSFISCDTAQHFSGDNDNLPKLQNPISREMDTMRPSILPGLIEAAGRNADMANKDVALFEVGPAFRTMQADGQDIMAAGIRAGNNAVRHWADSNAARAVDVYDAKADVLAALEAAGAPAANAQVTRDAPEYFHPGRSGSLRLGKNVLAAFGELHPALLDKMDIKTPVCGFEIYLNNIPAARNKSGTEKPLLQLEPLQPLSRDFAFLVDNNVEASDIVRAVCAAEKALISDVQVFDVYSGKGVPEGQKSVALSVTIQPRGETLKDKDIESLSQKITDLVQKKLGGALRG